MLARPAKLAWRLLHVGAWLIVLCGGTLLFLEESGLLTRLIRDRVAQELGDLGPFLSIGAVELLWFEPGIRFKDIAIAAPPNAELGAETNEIGEAGEDVVHLNEVHLSFEPGLDFRQPLRRVLVRGGYVRLSDDLSRALNLAGNVDGAAQTDESTNFAWDQLLSPPPVMFTGISVELDLPDERAFEIGRVSLLADPLGGGGYQLLGRLEPRLGGAIKAKSEAIQIQGRLQPSGLKLQATARNLAFSSEEMRSGSAADALPFERCAGVLTLSAALGLSDWGTATPQLSGEVRLSLREGALDFEAPRPGLETVNLDLDARVGLATGERLWRREAWSVRAHTTARWLDTPVESWAAFGRDIPGSDWVHAWARLPLLPVDKATLDALSVPEEMRDLYYALHPEGTADVTLDVRLADPPPLAGGSALQPRIAVHLALAESASATYVGVTDLLTGKRNGFPLPTRDLKGHVLFAHDPRAPSPDQVFINATGSPGSGKVLVRGEIFSPVDAPEDFLAPQMDLSIEVEGLSLAEDVKLALSSHVGTVDLWDTWSPELGFLNSNWRLYSSVNAGGLTAEGTAELKAASMRWAEIPIPLSLIDGSLHFVWAAQPVRRTDDPSGLLLHRPMGLSYRFSNLDAPDGSGTRASAFGMARQRSVGAQAVGKEVEIQPWSHAVEVRIPELFLRGRDWEILAARTPELEEITRSLGVKGSASAVYRGVSPFGATHFVSDIVARPLQVEVSPEFFLRRTQDLTGRVLVRTKSEVLAIGLEPPPATTEVRFHMSGRWSQGVELGGNGMIPVEGMALIDIRAAGIDPTNNAFRGAFLSAISEGDESGLGEVDLTDRSLSGLLDVGVTTSFEVNTEAEPNNAFQVFLRGNTLSTEDLTLGGLRGVLTQGDGILRSELIRAELGGHPFDMRDVLLMRLGDSAGIAESDPLLSEPGTWSDPDGLGFQARISTNNLPLDVEHLSAFLPAEAIAPLADAGSWSGELDVRDARILVTSEGTDEGIVAVSGLFRPHDLTTQLGVPIRIRSADLNLGEMIFESGRVRGWGEITNLAAELAGRRLDDASMVIGYVDGRLTIDNLAGEFEGGKLVALGEGSQGSRKALGIDLSPPYRFDVALSFAGVELDRLLRGVFPSSIADKGKVDLQLSLSGIPGDVSALTGGGWVRLDDGRLWSIPVARALFYQLGLPDTAIFDRMRARFSVHGGRIEGSYLEMKSSLINLIGNGWLDLDGRLAMDLEVRYSILDKLGPLSRILYWLNDNLWRVAVRGDLSRPRVTIRNFIFEFIRGFDDEPRRELPLPGISRLGSHF